MNARTLVIVVALVVGMSLSVAYATKLAASRAYVQSGPGGIFYARCIPKDDIGAAGFTDIYRVNKDRDELVDHYDWYARDGVVLGWSPIAGKVAVMARPTFSHATPDKQVELTLHLGGKLIKSITTADLARLGAEVRQIMPGDERKGADFQVLGCEQDPGTNNYLFVLQFGKDKKVYFNILTGDEFHK